MLDKEDVKRFIRKLENDTNNAMRKLATKRYPAKRVTFRLDSISPCQTKFTYHEIENGVIKGKCVIGQGPDGRLKVVNSWFVTPQTV